MVHPRWHTPYVAILVQATLGTIFLLVSVLGKGTSVEDVYLILLDTQILIYFIPYLYLFIVFLIHRRRGENASDVVLAPGGSIGAWLTGSSGIIVTLFAMIIAQSLHRDMADSLLFRLKVIGGAFGFISHRRIDLLPRSFEGRQSPRSSGVKSHRCREVA